MGTFFQGFKEKYPSKHILFYFVGVGVYFE